MKFIIDHDLHIHTYLSPCSNDPLQTPECILKYGCEKGLKHLAITDHFWDSAVEGSCFRWVGYDSISKFLPLPSHEGTQLHLGCEADMNMYGKIGLSKQTAKKLDFIIVPTTHMHFTGRTIREEEACDKKARAMRYIERWDALLNSDLPFEKVGLAHITWDGLAGGKEAKWTDHIEILDSITDDTFTRLFSETEKKGIGVELNVDIDRYKPDELDRILRVYRIAVNCGCHFYVGSDAHHPDGLYNGYDKFTKLVSLLDLDEDQKFNPFK